MLIRTTLSLLLFGLGNMMLHAQGLNLEWATAFGLGGSSVGTEIVVDAEGNHYVSGVLQSNVPVDLNPSPLPGDTAFAQPFSIFIAKYNPQGNYLWSHSLPGQISTGQSLFAGLAIAPNGDVALCSGTSQRIDADPSAAELLIGKEDSYTIYVIRYSSDGGLVWATEIPLTASSAGNTNHQFAFKGLSFTSTEALVFSGTIYVNGQDSLTFDFDAAGAGLELTTNGRRPNFFIGKLDREGRTEWAGLINGSSNSSSDQLYDIALDSKDNIYLSGTINGEGAFYDFDIGPEEDNLALPVGTRRAAFLVKYDTNGKLLRTGLTTDGLTNGRSIAIDEADNVYQIGFYTGVVNFNLQEGDPIQIGDGSGNIYLTKYSPNGDFVWGYEAARVAAGSANPVDIFCDQKGYLYLSGSVNGGFNFDFLGGNTPLQAVEPNNSLPFVAKYSTRAELIYAFGFAETFFSAARGVATDAKSNVYVTGSFRNTTDFDPSDGVFELTGSNINSLFTAKFAPCFFGEAEQSLCAGDTIRVGSTVITQAGDYPISFLTVDFCDSVVVYQITVSPLPDAGISVSGGTLSLAQEGAQYAWYNCSTQVLILGETGQSFTPTVSGTYGALVVLGSCFAPTECVEVVVSGLFEATLAMGLQVWPNPTQDQLHISLSADLPANALLRILDLSGRTQLLERITTDPMQLSISQLPAGVYLIRVESELGVSGVEKVVRW